MCLTAPAITAVVDELASTANYESVALLERVSGASRCRTEEAAVTCSHLTAKNITKTAPRDTRLGPVAAVRGVV